jgi:ankyrin repeat protein
VKALITCGKDVGINAPGASNAMGTNGGTPLILAAYNGNLEGVQLLLQHKADIEASDGDGDKALAQAAWNGQAPVLKALLDAGATINSMSADGSTALHHAATNGHRICVQELLDGGADPNLVNRRGEKPLHLAVQGGFISIVKLLDKKMDIDGVPGESTEVLAAVKKARESSGDGEGELPQNRYESRNYKL